MDIKIRYPQTGKDNTRVKTKQESKTKHLVKAASIKKIRSVPNPASSLVLWKHTSHKYLSTRKNELRFQAKN